MSNAPREPWWRAGGAEPSAVWTAQDGWIVGGEDFPPVAGPDSFIKCFMACNYTLTAAQVYALYDAMQRDYEPRWWRLLPAWGRRMLRRILAWWHRRVEPKL